MLPSERSIRIGAFLCTCLAICLLFSSVTAAGGPWPADIAAPAETDAYWDIREAVRLYDEALANTSELEGMVLGSVVDHVQSAPGKPHLRQAFEGWRRNAAWVKINPGPTHLIEADPALAGRTDLPDLAPNTPPADWSDVEAYAMPEDIPDRLYQLAAVWQMADRAHDRQVASAYERGGQSAEGVPVPCVSGSAVAGLGACLTIIRLNRGGRELTYAEG